MSSSSRSRPGTPVSSQGEPPGDRWSLGRRFGLAALPLALAGLLPWWCVLLLCALFAASVLSEAWRDGRLLLSVLLVGVAVVPGVLEATRSGASGWNLFLALQNTYFVGLFGTLLLHWAASALAEGNRAGLLVTAGVGLLAPQPWLVLALAGGALSREGADDRLGLATEHSPEAVVHARRYAAWLGAALGALLLFALVLPRSQVNLNAQASQTAPGSAPVSRPPADPPPARTAGGQANGAAPQSRLALDSGGRVPTPPLELSLLMGGLMVLALAYRLLTLGGAPGRRFGPLEWLIAAALLLNAALFFVMAQTPGGGPAAPAAVGQGAPGAGGLAGEAPAALRRMVPLVMDGMNLLVWLTLALQALLLAAVLVWVIQTRRRKAEAALSTADDDLASPPADAGAASGHRVRLAYRAAQQALHEHGWARQGGETPTRYAQRLAGARPEFGPALTLLTALYQPVRYGGRVTEQDAGQAEQAARELTRLAALHPFTAPPFTTPDGTQELA